MNFITPRFKARVSNPDFGDTRPAFTDGRAIWVGCSKSADELTLRVPIAGQGMAQEPAGGERDRLTSVDRIPDDVRRQKGQTDDLLHSPP